MREYLGKLLFYAVTVVLCLLVRQGANVWLVGENRGRTSGDNGTHFFRYARARNKDTYLLVNSLSADLEENTDGLVRMGGLRHAYLLARSTHLIYTHTPRDIVFARLYRFLLARRKTVYLKHGITAFKRFNVDYKTRREEVDMLVACSNIEADIIRDDLGIDREKISVTGFARFDALRPFEKGAARPIRKILYLPTWRDWIGTDDLESSEFFKRINAVISSRHLATQLELFGASLTLLLHINMRNHAHRFGATGNVSVEYGEGIDVQALIRDHDALITDYSSVAWDFLYLRKPVAFYPFDLEEYLGRRGACIDIRGIGNLFGRVANSEEALIELLESLIAQPVALTETEESTRDNWFAYTDQQNSQRIYHQVVSL